jgi:hypothetical protein
VAALGYENVCGFDVTVNDACRVRGLQSVGYIGVAIGQLMSQFNTAGVAGDPSHEEGQQRG